MSVLTLCPPLISASGQFRDIESGQQQRPGLRSVFKSILARAGEHLSAAGVSSRPITRIDLNLATGVLKARRELIATEVAMGWSGRTAASEFFFGSLLESMLSDRDYSLVISRPCEPLSACRRILLAIPPDAELEPGFPNAITLAKRIARQLDAEPLLIGESRRARVMCASGLAR